MPDHANLTVALGDVADTAWLAGQLHGQDAVISAYNPGWGEDNLYEKTTRGAQQILTAVEQSGVKRLLVVGGAGSLEVAPGVELVDTPQFPENIRPGAQAVRDLRNKLRNESALDWTYLSPAALLEPGKRTGQFRLGTTQLLMNGDAPPAFRWKIWRWLSSMRLKNLSLFAPNSPPPTNSPHRQATGLAFSVRRRQYSEFLRFS